MADLGRFGHPAILDRFGLFCKLPATADPDFAQRHGVLPLKLEFTRSVWSQVRKQVAKTGTLQPAPIWAQMDLEASAPPFLRPPLRRFDFGGYYNTV